jgi:phospholipase D1/2
MNILQPDRNCWRIETADRVAFLIDGEAYFGALRRALLDARQAVYIVAWDIYSELALVRGEDAGDAGNGGDHAPVTLKALLNSIARERPALRIYILNWDFVMLYGMDREWLPVYKLDWDTHRHIHFHLDDQHPLGASRHQKVVVVDDTLAFVGGLDPTRGRWDTPRHAPDDARRGEPQARPTPHHDVQMLVSGNAARALGELARARWATTARKRLEPCRPEAEAARWPQGVNVDLEDADVAIARTEPAYAGTAELREVQRLYLDAVHAARRFIYIENQYFTAPRVVDALAERLASPQGPEVVIVTPKHTTGWLSQVTMDMLRNRAVRSMQAADAHGRLRVFYPELPGLGEDCLNVHSKVMVVDDRFVRVGSSNLNNRSMGLDAECDLAIEIDVDHEGHEGAAQKVEAIAVFRRRLLAEHLGTSVDALAQAEQAQDSLVAAIDSLRGGERTLAPLPLVEADEFDRWVPDVELLDPERPVDPESLAQQFVHEEERAPAGRRIWLWVAALLALGGLAAAWRWTPLSQYLDVAALLEQATRFAELPGAPLLAIGAFVLGGLVAFPVTLMIVLTVLSFGTVAGFLSALAGSLASALAGYGLGVLLGRHTVRRLAGGRLNRISRHLAKRGLLAVVLARVVPIAPYSLVNLVGGASHVSLRDFALGTLIGMTPGIAAITLFTDRIRAMLEEPTWQNGLTLTLVFAGIALAATVLVHWLRRRAGSAASDASPAD